LADATTITPFSIVYSLTLASNAKSRAQALGGFYKRIIACVSWCNLKAIEIPAGLTLLNPANAATKWACAVMLHIQHNLALGQSRRMRQIQSALGQLMYFQL
jgi:hypothetical protein